MNYPPPEEIPSAERQRLLYIQAVKEIHSLRDSVKNENIVGKESRQELLETRKEVQKEKEVINKFGLDPNEIEDIFDLIESEE